MDFKAQILKDLKVFHNPGEFATMTRIWYNGNCYTVPIVIDHETAKDRKTLVNDHAEGINLAEALVYILMIWALCRKKAAISRLRKQGQSICTKSQNQIMKTGKLCWNWGRLLNDRSFC